MADIFEIAGRIHSTSQEEVVTVADEILDTAKNKKQDEINTETYSLVNDINERLSGLNPEQQGALSVAAKATNNETKLGYYVCGTEGNVAAKVISDATGYVLSTGGSIKIKMTNANIADNATLNINSTGAKPLYYDGERASANNSWEAGETVEVYYDGNNFYANNVAGSGGEGVFDVSEKYPTSGIEGGNTYTLEGALTVLNANLPASKKKGGMSIKFVQSSDNKYVQYRLMSQSFSGSTESDWQGVDDKPTAGSDNLVKSGGVFDSLVSGGIIDEEITTKTIGAQGSVFVPFNFKKGAVYKMILTSTTNATLQVVFTSSTESTETQVDQLSNIALVANVSTIITYTPSNDANYFHYWCSSSFNCELKIIGYVQTNIRDLINEGHLYKGIAIPTTNPQTPKTKVFYLATQAGTYTNFLDSNSTPIVVVQGLSVIKFNGTAWSVEQVFGIDDEPTLGSNNLVKSGGVYEEISQLGQEWGYFECDTPAGTWIKAVTAPGYSLKTGGAIKIKFENHNEASTVFLNIGSSGNKSLYYNGQIANQYNSWNDNETILVYYDGTQYQGWSLEHKNEIFDISAANNGAKYSALGYALAALPMYVQPRPVIVRYIDSATDKYVQFHCVNPSDTLDQTLWQSENVTEQVASGVKDPVSGGGVYDALSPINPRISNLDIEVFGESGISAYNFNDNRVDYCVVAGGTIIRNIYAQYVVSGYIALPDNWTKIKLESLIDGGGSRYFRLSETTNDNEVGYADGLTGAEKEIVYNPSFANYKYLTFTTFAAPNGTPIPDLSGIKVYLYKDGLEERVTTLEEENIPADKMSFSKRCFDFGQKSPQKPCVTITFDVLDNFSFGASKDLFDYIDFLNGYGIPASSFFIRPIAGQIGNVADYVNAYKMGQDICIHSIHTDSFGDNDTENPHPSLADAEVLLQNYQKWFKTNGFPYSMGWVTSRGQLYAPYFDLLPKYISYGHTLGNHDIKGASDVSDLYNYINKRTDDKMKIIRLGIENDQADGNTEETKIINYTKALIDKTIETNGFLCLYGHGFDNMSAPYTMRESVLTGILTYLKTKIDNLEILVGSEAEIVPYFYE